MAVTASATITTGAASLPDAYVPPILTPIVATEEGKYTVDLAIALADPSTPSTGIANVLGAAETDFETVQAVNRKLDVAQTITANLTLRKVQRLNTLGVDDGNIFVAGTEVYRCTIDFEWA